ncbi:MAG TPA: MliC family protein, partial [Allocoleopsis sp.]
MMKIIHLSLFSLPIVLSIVALPGQAQANTVTYRCDGGRTFEAEFNQESAQLRFGGDQVLDLSQVRSASGARYSDGETTLFIKGKDAFIQTNDTVTYDNCIAQTDSAPQQAMTPPPSTVIAYRCQGGQTFQAAYRSASADLILNGETVTLPRVPTMSGVQYSDGYTTLTSSESEAVIDRNGTPAFANCTAQATTTTGQVTTTETTLETQAVVPATVPQPAPVVRAPRPAAP